MSKMAPEDTLLRDVRGLIEDARSAVASTVNAGLTMLYWQVGRRIRQEILKEERAEYGAAIVVTLSRQLQQEFGNRFSEKSLRRMMQFYEVFSEEEKVAPLLKQLSWSHFVELIPPIWYFATRIF
jgi:DUF1016 N-terminal domain